jgi:putative peptidoglycan lipid II flippase
MIVALLFSNPNEPQNGVYYLSIGVIVGGILQLMTHLIAIKRKRVWRVLKVGLFKFKEKKRNYKEFYKNFWHSVLGNSTAQLASFIDTWLASFLVSGSISYLYYSNRIFQLPLALFAIALSISLFPKIAKQVNKKEVESANKTLKDGFWVLAFLLLPSTVGGYMLAPEIVKILFERGAFLKEDSLQTAKVLQMYLIGLAPFGLSRLFSLWLYSMGLQAKAAKISAISLILNIILSILLISPYGASGLALASSISGFLLFILTIKAYGTKKFLAILHLKQIAILAIVLILEIFLLTIFKEILNAYL